MSMVNNLASFFKSGGAAAPDVNANRQQAAGGAALENAAVNQAQHSQTQAAALVADNAQTVSTPLASFDKMWDIDSSKQASAPTGVLPAVTAEQLTATLANSNFLTNVDPAILTRAAGGDAQAFQDVINQGLRQVMTQSVLASHGLVEAGARNHGEQLRISLPTMVRSSNVVDSLQSNPLYSNPAAKPMVDGIRSQLELKNPTASSQEIARLTNEYLNDFARLVSTNDPATKQQASSKAATGDTDWYKMLGL